MSFVYDTTRSLLEKWGSSSHGTRDDRAEMEYSDERYTLKKELEGLTRLLTERERNNQRMLEVQRNIILREQESYKDLVKSGIVRKD
ncbi:hypothetical protein Q1695_004351 [Nippostrongylus brasiliensis]|nr:hypothetical protein Q1695_004351 [Nippostrongylus brasiliensis]